MAFMLHSWGDACPAQRAKKFFRGFAWSSGGLTRSQKSNAQGRYGAGRFATCDLHGIPLNSTLRPNLKRCTAVQ